MIGVFLDFSKAFDTVNHHILLQKLYRYGIRGSANDWFTSYLSNRKQYVSYKNIPSSYKKITCGVPQGSILGPLLFLLYINDIINVSKLLFAILFADDTNVFLNGNDIDNLICTLNRELDKLVVWLQVNKLSLNVNKTHYMIFTPWEKKKHKYIVPDIIINGKVLSKVSSTCFLGVIIDDKLKWDVHVLKLKQKISKGLGILCKARKLLPKDILLQLYYSFIYPYLTYGIVVWGSTCQYILDSLFKLQKRAVRLVTMSTYNTHTANLFRCTNILQVQKVYVFNVMIFMFKFHKCQLLGIFSHLFQPITVVHGHFTRHNYRLHVTI